MNKRQHKQHISSLPALLLFALFAVCILSVLVTGAGVYRRVAERDDSSYAHRTAVQYVSSKVRQADDPSRVTVEDFHGIPAITLRQELGNIALLTRVYCHEGWLRELYYLEGNELSPADGEKILPMDHLTAELADDLLLVQLTDTDGRRQQLALALRTGREGGS